MIHRIEIRRDFSSDGSGNQDPVNAYLVTTDLLILNNLYCFRRSDPVQLADPHDKIETMEALFLPAPARHAPFDSFFVDG